MRRLRKPVWTVSDPRVRIGMGPLVLLSALGFAGCGTPDPVNPQLPPAAAVVFSAQPGNTVAGLAIAAIEVTVVDASQRLVTNATDLVTIALGDNPGGGTLSGTTTVNAVGGIARFNDLSIDRRGSGYTLVATSGDLTSATSTPIDITLLLSFAAVPAQAEVNDALATVQVAIVDGAGTTVSDASDEVTIAIGHDPFTVGVAATLSGTATAPASGGVADFTDLVIDRGGTGFTLTASGAGSPVVTSDPFDVVLTLSTVTAGGTHTCATQVTGTTYCWGAIDYGLGQVDQLGGRPVPVIGGDGFTTISAAGMAHTCGLATGQAMCWGPNDLGQLGDGSPGAHSPTPILVAGGITLTSVSAGGDHTCGLTAAGTAYCWGYNGDGQLGAVTTVDCPGNFTAVWPCSPTPVPVGGGLTFERLSAGPFHTCGVTVANAAYCWGSNGDGQLGAATSETCAPSGQPCSTTPLAVNIGLPIVSVAAGMWHSCAATTSGDAYCWGDNGFGQLGDGNAGTDSFTPVSVQGGGQFVSLTAGVFHTCGLTASGSVSCWGANGGQLGVDPSGTLCNGGFNCSDVPVTVGGGHAFVAIDAGGKVSTGHRTCGITQAGAAFCWGGNGMGELGDGTMVSGFLPVQVVTP